MKIEVTKDNRHPITKITCRAYILNPKTNEMDWFVTNMDCAQKYMASIEKKENWKEHFTKLFKQRLELELNEKPKNLTN